MRAGISKTTACALNRRQNCCSFGLPLGQLNIQRSCWNSHTEHRLWSYSCTQYIIMPGYIINIYAYLSQSASDQLPISTSQHQLHFLQRNKTTANIAAVIQLSTWKFTVWWSKRIFAVNHLNMHTTTSELDESIMPYCFFFGRCQLDIKSGVIAGISCGLHSFWITKWFDTVGGIYKI